MPTVSTQALEGTQPQRNLNASPTLSIVSANTTPFQLPQFPGDCGHRGSQGHHGHSRGASSSSVTNPDAPDESLQEDKNGRIHGGASEFAFMQLAKKRLANLPAMSIDFPDDPLPCPAGLAAVLPPKDIADQLTARYFEFGLSTSRLVHKPSLIQIVDKIYSGEECKPDDLALAYIVLALGSHYSDHTSPFCGYSASVRFYDVAHAQLEETPDLITLATSQARLLIIHFLLNHARMHEAWSAFGIVVRHVQALGLHRRSRPADADCIRYEYRKRLFWCVYINDRILSSMFGRPLAIHDDDIDQDECALANDEDIDESKCKLTKDGLFCSSAGLVHYARIARILGQILRVFYTPASRLQDVSQLHASATVFEKGLRDWEDGLPPYLNYIVLPPSAVSVTAQRQMCTLKLMSAHASLLLYRPFILHAINRNAEQTPNLQWIKTCHEKCIEAAKTVVSECHYLSQRGLFSRTFWLVTYMQFASIGTLLTYSYLWPEDITARKTAEDAMAEFPAGIDGDPVGQRYLATLKELREMTVRARDGSYRGRPLIFDSSPETQIEVLGNESSDQGQWINFFDASLLDEMVVGYNTNG
ncbi:putative finger protein [Rosellinia necatrix]|uniref:Putative finger protein n=1 Tax=Rosellinia necatrix TaxID=77044 RepID=A0A1W2TMA5_ROSNE|nr:putative finger protein [Rosellinia necatrix]